MQATSETKPESTKYKFDYSVEVPAETKAVDYKERTYSGRVDKVVGYKPGKHK